jgi:hypothetical protein
VADLVFHVVDGVVVVNHALGRAFVAALDHVDGRFQLRHGQLAHAHDLAAQAIQLGVVALDDVIGGIAHVLPRRGSRTGLLPVWQSRC